MAVYVYDDNRIFLSTPSARRATKDSLCMANLVYISIHALREEGDPGSRHPDHPASISIHALREEGDVVGISVSSNQGISIHALREEGDRTRARQRSLSGRFLSTPSARRATAARCCALVNASDFYPRPPRGGRRADCSRSRRQAGISIHALREEGDSKNRDKISIFKQIIQHSARI